MSVVRLHVHGRKTTPDIRHPNCGHGIPFGSKICPYCGKKFETFL